MSIAGPQPGRNGPSLQLIAADERHEERYFTALEAAKYLTISLRSVQTRVAAGEIPVVRMRRPGATRGPVRFRKSDLDAYAARCVADPVDRRPRT